MDAPKTSEFAHIGKSVVIKGELSGSEDLYVDGNVEGSIELRKNSLIIGPNGKVKADISAREVVVRGNVDGKIDGSERVQLWNSGRVTGEVRTERLAIEDGAVLRGKVEAGKAQSRSTDGKQKSAASDSVEKPKTNSAAASSHTRLREPRNVAANALLFALALTVAVGRLT